MNATSASTSPGQDRILNAPHVARLNAQQPWVRGRNAPAPCSTDYNGGGGGSYFVGLVDSTAQPYYTQNVAGGPDSAVLGGTENYACGLYAGVGAGDGNMANGNDAFVAGGIGNTAPGTFASVSSGEGNVALGFAAFEGAGTYNGAESSYSFVGSGTQNIATGTYAFIGAGQSNTAGGNETFIGGGENNVANGVGAFVGGGEFDTVATAAPYSVLAGGYDNTISVNGYSAIGGGLGNTSEGKYATIPGGFHDEAFGELSFAAGYEAEALNNGSFVWGDYSSAAKAISDTAADQFVIRASGGTYIYSNEAASTGVSLAPGSGTWGSLSDRNQKTDVSAIDDDSILAKVARLPVSTWRYRSEAGVRHVGPMAQDFYASFGVGEDDRHITSVDEDGVALSAIKALHRENEALQYAARQKNYEIDKLRLRLTRLEARVSALTPDDSR